MTDLEVVRYCVRECTGDDGAMMPATHGEYCTRCWKRIDTALRLMGELSQHLIGNAITTSGSGEDRVDSSKSAPLPFNQAAFDDASELYSLLVYWSTVFAGAMHTPPPQVAQRAWRNDRGIIIGLPAGTSPGKAGKYAERLSGWLRDRLDTILALGAHDDVDALTEAVSDVWRINARWPRREKPAYSPIPCPLPDCARRIAVYPPNFPGEELHAVCDAGHYWTEDQFDHLKLVFQQVAKERVRAAKVAKHLTKKFGWSA